MKNQQTTHKDGRKRLLYVCYAGLIAALYTVLTMVVGSFGLASGVIQLRISEALCILPFFTPAAIPGLAIGCLLSNLLQALIWQDIVFGTFATLLGALGAYWLRRFPWLTPLPTVLANTVIVPLVLAYGYHAEEGLFILMMSIGIGEVLSAYVLGMLLLLTLKQYRNKLFL